MNDQILDRKQRSLSQLTWLQKHAFVWMERIWDTPSPFPLLPCWLYCKKLTMISVHLLVRTITFLNLFGLPRNLYVIVVYNISFENGTTFIVILQQACQTRLLARAKLSIIHKVEGHIKKIDNIITIVQNKFCTYRMQHLKINIHGKFQSC